MQSDTVVPGAIVGTANVNAQQHQLPLTVQLAAAQDSGPRARQLAGPQVVGLVAQLTALSVPVHLALKQIKIFGRDCNGLEVYLLTTHYTRLVPVENIETVLAERLLQEVVLEIDHHWEPEVTLINHLDHEGFVWK